MSKAVWHDNYNSSKQTPKEALPKINYSTWQMTISSNMHDSPEVRKKFKEIIAYIFDPDNITDFMRGDVDTLLSAEIEGALKSETREMTTLTLTLKSKLDNEEKPN